MFVGVISVGASCWLVFWGVNACCWVLMVCGLCHCHLGGGGSGVFVASVAIAIDPILGVVIALWVWLLSWEWLLLVTWV